MARQLDFNVVSTVDDADLAGCRSGLIQGIRNVWGTNARNFLRNRPLLSRWFNGVTIKTGQKIALEDDAIIKDQLPRAVSYSGSNEVLVESDRILIDFRRMMRRHQA